MTVRNTLKSWFERGKKPTQNQFAELIDSLFHRTEDSLGIDQVTGLQAALDSKADNGAQSGAVVPVQMVNDQSGSISVGDITLHSTIKIDYSIIRGDLREVGTLTLENRDNVLLMQVSDFDDSGFALSKSIVENDLRLAWTDQLINGTNGLLYIVNIFRTFIPE